MLPVDENHRIIEILFMFLQTVLNGKLFD